MGIGTGEGDPHITRFDGLKFDFHGEPGKSYNLATTPAVAIEGKLFPLPSSEADGTPRTVIGRLVVRVGDVVVEVADRGRVRVTGPGGVDIGIHAVGCSLACHDPETDRPEDELNSVAYINYRVEHPDTPPGSTGLMVDGDESSVPSAYEVPG